MERTIFIDAQGSQYSFTDPPDKVVISEEGTGNPEIDYITERGPFQHGETLEDFYLQPRIVQMVVRQNYCSRSEYWAGRTALINALRPNKGQGVLRKILGDGTVRDLDVYILEGPGFSPRGSVWDEWSFQEVLRFKAFNPLYYDPSVHAINIASSGDALTFPVTFPISFPNVDFSPIVTYNGSWIEYPNIVITGPITNINVQNLTTGETLKLLCNVASGRIATFTLTYGSKSVLLEDGTNLVQYLSNDSDLATFHLEPGLNNLKISGGGVTVDTKIQFSWKERFLGI
jgi:hypothetical protein